MSPHRPYRDDAQDAALDTDDDYHVPSSTLLHVRSPSDSSESLPQPAWLKRTRKTLAYDWLPASCKRAGRAVARWVKGPQPPVELQIRPYFPSVQGVPIRILNAVCPTRKQKFILLLAFYSVWFTTWALLLKRNTGTGNIVGYGQPSNIWCGATFWESGNGCGVNGNDCRPFSNQYLAFKCAANCANVHTYSPHQVGNETIRFDQVVIGGPPADDPDGEAIYRADSFICQAAIHAGAIENDVGGCGVAMLVGEHTGYPGSTRHGIRSREFPASFPKSFMFEHLSADAKQCPTDSRWGIFAVSATALVILSLFTTDPAVFFWSSFVIMMFQVGLVSDPPNRSNFYELLSTLIGKLLPASFIAAIMYRWAARPLLTDLRAPVEKTVLYYGPFFTACLNNYTFAPLIPIARLTPHDLAQHGAALALSIIVTCIVVIVVTQIHWIRISGNMPRYLVVYSLIGLTLIVLVSLPGLRLRIHHYILGLIFMPGTAFRVRPSLVYQGLLLGFFINGVARWGFDPIIQTPAALGESDGGSGSGGSWWGAKAPMVNATVLPDMGHIQFNWGGLPEDTGVDGVSILINDVERWRGFTDEELYWKPDQVTLRRRSKDSDEDEFYRFAWVNGDNTGRYSKVGVWDANGTWHEIPR